MNTLVHLSALLVCQTPLVARQGPPVTLPTVAELVKALPNVNFGQTKIKPIKFTVKTKHPIEIAVTYHVAYKSRNSASIVVVDNSDNTPVMSMFPRNIMFYNPANHGIQIAQSDGALNVELYYRDGRLIFNVGAKGDNKSKGIDIDIASFFNIPAEEIILTAKLDNNKQQERSFVISRATPQGNRIQATIRERGDRLVFESLTLFAGGIDNPILIVDDFVTDGDIEDWRLINPRILDRSIIGDAHKLSENNIPDIACSVRRAINDKGMQKELDITDLEITKYAQVDRRIAPLLRSMYKPWLSR